MFNGIGMEILIWIFQQSDEVQWLGGYVNEFMSDSKRSFHLSIKSLLVLY